jgi:hypothetical protein
MQWVVSTKAMTQVPDLPKPNQQQASLAGIWASPAKGVVPKSTSAAGQKKQFPSYYVITEK